MIIKIEDGLFTRSDDAAALLTAKESEYLAALSQKLIVRQELQGEKERQRRIRENQLYNGDQD